MTVSSKKVSSLASYVVPKEICSPAYLVVFRLSSIKRQKMHRVIAGRSVIKHLRRNNWRILLLYDQKQASEKCRLTYENHWLTLDCWLARSAPSFSQTLSTMTCKAPIQHSPPRKEAKVISATVRYGVRLSSAISTTPKTQEWEKHDES